MGGDRTFSRYSSTEDGSSSLDRELPEQTFYLSKPLSENVLGSKVQNGSANGEPDLDFGRFGEPVWGTSSNSLGLKADERRARNIYADVLASFDELQCRGVGLEEAKSKIMSYRPGSWIENAGSLKLDDYHLPETTTILLIGPRGSGKSSLVNRMSKVFESDKFASERAQVSYHSSIREGTCFLHEYMIPRASNAFCLYDTRSMSSNMFENMKELKYWMTKGVRHCELVKRSSDDADLKSKLSYKARQIGPVNSKIRMVNFVIMVVNGISVLESMNAVDGKKKHYSEMIATVFNSPFLSFKDDKPVVVVTHGDLLTISDRVRIRIYLGELLGIPPKTQIFDIPESNDLANKLTIIDLLRHCLEHADRNLPCKSRSMVKMATTYLSAYLMLLLLAVGIAFMQDSHTRRASRHSSPPDVQIDWDAIRHLWSD